MVALIILLNVGWQEDEVLTMAEAKAAKAAAGGGAEMTAPGGP